MKKRSIISVQRSVFSDRLSVGFTLTEVLISIGIMGIGLTMAAALFPAGIAENEKSFNDAVGTLICENGITLAKTVLGDGNVPATMDVLADEITVNNISRLDQHYPIGTDDSDLQTYEDMRGFVLLGRNDGDVQQLIAIAYKREQNHLVAAVDISNLGTVTTTLDTSDNTRCVLSGLSATEWLYVKRGGLLVSSDGQIGRIVAYDGTNVFVHPNLISPVLPFRTLVEMLTNNTAADPATAPLSDRTPSMAVMVVRTKLRN